MLQKYDHYNKKQKAKNQQQTTNNKQQTTNNQQQTTNNKQQTTNNQQPTTNNKQQITKCLVTGIITVSNLLLQCWLPPIATAQTSAYCKFSQEEISTKENLRQQSSQGNPEAKNKYQALLQKHGEMLRQCRDRSWLKTQAIWLRVYPCDARPGALDRLLDDIVNKGYNQVYVGVFYDSQVLLPQADNPTPWVSVINSSNREKVDLLADTIAKGKERGLKVYAWMFTMNFGYSYSRRPDRRGVLARNGKGENSLDIVRDHPQVFIDPYNKQAQADLYRLIQEIIQRRPDGILFDYIRYPRGSGSQSVVGNVKDLWIYSPASRQALYDRAENNQGRMLIQRYLNQGNIFEQDLMEISAMYPEEEMPLWQGSLPLPITEDTEPKDYLPQLREQLWHLVVAHAAQGVVDFLSFATNPAIQEGIPVGAVFFPGGNQLVGQRGFDSRLQPWENFSPSIEWHPMSYAVCGYSDCIVEQVERVRTASANGYIIPALAGTWGKFYHNRPSLEEQMDGIRLEQPQVNAISHFAYSWQEPELDRDRKFCIL